MTECNDYVDLNFYVACYAVSECDRDLEAVWIFRLLIFRSTS